MRILIATEGSLKADKALRFCTQFTHSATRPPTVLVVAPHRKGHQLPTSAEIKAIAFEMLGPEVPEVQPKVRIGKLVQEIISEAIEGDFELIIMSNRRQNLWGHLLRPSAAIRVMEQAPCPALVVQGEVRPVRRILLCDSGASSEPVLGRFTAKFAEMLGVQEEVTILHVMSQMSAGPGVRGKQLRADVEELIAHHSPEGELLKRDVKVLDLPGIQSRPQVRHGMVVDEILEEAQRGDYDLVVIGAHRLEGWQRVLLDDLAKKIVRKMDRPVLVV